MPSELFFIPQGVGAALPPDTERHELTTIAMTEALHAPFFSDGQATPMLLLRAPNYLPTVNVSSIREREAAIRLSNNHPHRLWLLRTEIHTERRDAIDQAVAALTDWHSRTPFRACAAPGIELSPYHLEWTTDLVAKWGKQPNYYLFDIDISGYDNHRQWRHDIDLLCRWLGNIGPMARALLHVTLPKSPDYARHTLDTLWTLARHSFPILAVLCSAHIAASFIDPEAGLSVIGDIYKERNLHHAKLRSDGQASRETWHLAEPSRRNRCVSISQ